MEIHNLEITKYTINNKKTYANIYCMINNKKCKINLKKNYILNNCLENYILENIKIADQILYERLNKKILFDKTYYLYGINIISNDNTTKIEVTKGIENGIKYIPNDIAVIDISKIKEEKEVFDFVYIVNYENNRYIMKTIYNNNSINIITNEIMAYMKIGKNKNIVNFEALVKQDNEIIGILLEYCENGDLNDFDISVINYEKRLQWAYDLISLIKDLNSKNIFIVDIKPNNIVIDKNMNIKLCDLGSAYFNGCEENRSFYTNEWAHPNLINTLIPNNETEMYSINLIIKNKLKINDYKYVYKK